jgi:hypothetical protein
VSRLKPYLKFLTISFLLLLILAFHLRPIKTMAQATATPKPSETTTKTETTTAPTKNTQTALPANTTADTENTKTNNSSLLGFTSCNFTGQSSKAGSELLIPCLKDILTTVMIVSVFIGAFQVAKAALGSYMPDSGEDPQKVLRERLGKFMVGIPLVGGAVIILNLINPATLNINFLDFADINTTEKNTDLVEKAKETTKKPAETGATKSTEKTPETTPKHPETTPKPVETTKP